MEPKMEAQRRMFVSGLSRRCSFWDCGEIHWFKWSVSEWNVKTDWAVGKKKRVTG